MTDDDDELRQMLAAACAEFRAGLPDRIAAIDGLWERIISAGAAPAPVDDLILALHRIAGTAGTFGAAEVGVAAAAAESELVRYRESPVMPAAALDEVAGLLAQLRRTVAQS